MNKLFVAALKEETIGLNNFHHIGVGKINAAYNLTKLIHKYNARYAFVCPENRYHDCRIRCSC